MDEPALLLQRLRRPALAAHRGPARLDLPVRALPGPGRPGVPGDPERAGVGGALRADPGPSGPGHRRPVRHQPGPGRPPRRADRDPQRGVRRDRGGPARGRAGSRGHRQRPDARSRGVRRPPAAGGPGPVAGRGLPERAGPRAAAAGDSARPDRHDGRGPGARAAHDSHPRGIRTPTAGGITMTTTHASPTAQLPHFSLVIDGQLTEPVSGRSYDSVDPFSGAPWATAADGGEADVNLAVAAARRALAGPWGQLTGFGRARLMRRRAELIARDTGKLLREMRGQLGSIPDWFYYFSGLADKLEGSTIPADKPNFLVYTRREPAGVVAAIVPWNSPPLLLCWKLAPALAPGRTMGAKPSDYSPASAIALAGLLEEAGFPPGVFNVVSGLGPEVGKALAAHPGVDKIAFTGSTQVGAEVAKAAASNITGVLLELGG